MKNIDGIDKMKYIFNDARFKPTSTQIIDVLFNEKKFLEELPAAKLLKYFGTVAQTGLTKVQIETFVNTNYSNIFI